MSVVYKVESFRYGKLDNITYYHDIVKLAEHMLLRFFNVHVNDSEELLNTIKTLAITSINARLMEGMTFHLKDSKDKSRNSTVVLAAVITEEKASGHLLSASL